MAAEICVKEVRPICDIGHGHGTQGSLCKHASDVPLLPQFIPIPTTLEAVRRAVVSLPGPSKEKKRSVRCRIPSARYSCIDQEGNKGTEGDGEEKEGGEEGRAQADDPCRRRESLLCTAPPSVPGFSSLWQGSDRKTPKNGPVHEGPKFTQKLLKDRYVLGKSQSPLASQGPAGPPSLPPFLPRALH